MFTLLRRVASALIRLAVPSCPKSAENTLCTLPGILSASMRVPGSGVVPMTETSGSTGAGVLDSGSAHALAQPPAMDAMRANTANERRAVATGGLPSMDIGHHADRPQSMRYTVVQSNRHWIYAGSRDA